MAQPPKPEPIFMEMNQIPISEMRVDVTLRFTRLFRFRLWLGLKLFHLLSILWDCDIDVDYNDDPSRITEVDG